MEFFFYLSFPVYILLVTCNSERHQEQLLNKLWLKGFNKRDYNYEKDLL